MWGLSPFITSQNTGPQGHLYSKDGPDSGNGPGPPLVHCTIWGSPRNTLWCSPVSLQVSHASYWGGCPVRSLHVGGYGGGANDFSKPCRGGWATRGGTRALGGAGNHPTYTQPTWRALDPEGAVSSGVMAIMQRQLPPTPPGFSELLATKSGPPPLKDADSLAGAPWGGLARTNLFTGYADGHNPEHLDGGVTVSLWDQGHFPDILAFNSTYYPDQLNTHQELQEPWACKPLWIYLAVMGSANPILLHDHETLSGFPVALLATELHGWKGRCSSWARA